MTEPKKKGKTFTDKDGNQVPSGFIHKIDKAKHAAALRLCAKAEKISAQLSDFKTELFTICDELYDRALAEHKVIKRVNAKGGYTITTIDKKVKVEITMNEFVGFGDDISIAHELIKEWLAEKTQSVDPELTQIITSAFENSGGNLDVKRILGLKKYNIVHDKWKAAMEVIDRAYEVRNTKRYARIWVMNAEGEYKVVPLDFASIKPKEAA